MRQPIRHAPEPEPLNQPRRDRDSRKVSIVEEPEAPRTLWLRRARRAGELWERFPYEHDELLVHVSNKLKLLDVSIARNSSLLGRIYNTVTREELDSVVLDGVAVRQLFDLIGEDPPISVSTRSKYRIDHDELRKWYQWAVEAKSDPRSRRRRRSASRRR